MINNMDSNIKKIYKEETGQDAYNKNGDITKEFIKWMQNRLLNFGNK